MIRFFEPLEDTSIYEQFPGRQTGLDEILEIGKNDRGNRSIRSLLKFDIDSILSSVPGDAKFELVLRNAYTTKLRRDQEILAHPVTESWTEGSGYFYQDMKPSEDGATWESRQQGDVWGFPGGTFNENVEGSAVPSWPIPDWRIDISNVIDYWTAQPNEGLILKFPPLDEEDSSNMGNVRVFSKNSHTIHVPVLMVSWDDSEYDIIPDGSTDPIDIVNMDNILITPRNLKMHYKRGETVRINLSVRNRFPIKQFNQSFSGSAGTAALPQEAYFSVIDTAANKAVIPFGDSSKISTNVGGSWFTFTTEAMFILRNYKIIFKVIHDGQEVILDDNREFRIIR
jgi:hypothetical protein